MCGMNTQGEQRHDGIFIFGYTSLEMAVLLHNTALVNFPMATTVFSKHKIETHRLKEYSNVLYLDVLRNKKATTKPDMTPILRVRTRFFITGKL